MSIKRKDLKKYVRSNDGKFTQKTDWKTVVFMIVFVSILAAYANHTYALANLSDLPKPKTIDTGCKEKGEGTRRYVCTDPELLEKWFAYEVERSEKKHDITPLGILEDVCKERGVFSSDCPKDLYGMATVESYMGLEMTGDGGRSHGYFHIMDYHKVPSWCENDLRCSAAWSLDRMIRLDYMTNPDVAIMRHNGTPYIPATIKYLQKVKANHP